MKAKSNLQGNALNAVITATKNNAVAITVAACATAMLGVILDSDITTAVAALIALPAILLAVDIDNINGEL